MNRPFKLHFEQHDVCQVNPGAGRGSLVSSVVLLGLQCDTELHCVNFVSWEVKTGSASCQKKCTIWAPWAEQRWDSPTLAGCGSSGNFTPLWMCSSLSFIPAARTSYLVYKGVLWCEWLTGDKLQCSVSTHHTHTLFIKPQVLLLCMTISRSKHKGFCILATCDMMCEPEEASCRRFFFRSIFKVPPWTENT